MYGHTVRYGKMIIRSVRHRGLKRFIEENQAKGLRPELVDRVRNILTALIVAEDMKMLREGAPPGWRAGGFTDSQVIAKGHGASPRRETGGSPLRKKMAIWIC